MRERRCAPIIGPCASGALTRELDRGAFVVCDQFVDRTRGREDTFYDGPQTTHVSAADPFCPDLRRLLVETARERDIPVRDGGTVVVVQGPRFSTRAESRWFQAAGWHAINMTAYPECHLARELELCYATIAMVTDYDVGSQGRGGGVGRRGGEGAAGQQRAPARAAPRGCFEDRPAALGSRPSGSQTVNEGSERSC